jgi:hypothetical protein
VGKESVAGGVADVHDTLFRDTGELEEVDVVGGEDRVEHSLAGGVEVGGAHHVDLVADDERGLVGEEGLDGFVELALKGVVSDSNGASWKANSLEPRQCIHTAHSGP